MQQNLNDELCHISQYYLGHFHIKLNNKLRSNVVFTTTKIYEGKTIKFLESQQLYFDY